MGLIENRVWLVGARWWWYWRRKVGWWWCRTGMSEVGKQMDFVVQDVSENVCAQTRLCPVVKSISRLRDKEGPSAL